MQYANRYQPADDLITHLDTVIPGLNPFLTSRYVGFLCVSSVSVMELAVRDILVGFAEKKHRVFGAFCQDFYEKLNGRVTIKDLREMHVKRFGERYVSRFEKLLAAAEKSELQQSGRSIRASYGNLVTWRHSFAHQGVLPANASYGEAKQGFELGKQVLACMYGALQR